VFTNINERQSISSPTQTIAALTQLLSAFWRTDTQQAWWNWDRLLWILSHRQRYRLLQLL